MAARIGSSIDNKNSSMKMPRFDGAFLYFTFLQAHQFSPIVTPWLSRRLPVLPAVFPAFIVGKTSWPPGL
jgi:hypothetical protein